jgi:hypothetical protein
MYHIDPVAGVGIARPLSSYIATNILTMLSIVGKGFVQGNKSYLMMGWSR